MLIDIHPLTGNPTAAWEELKKTQRVIKITMKPPKDEIPRDKVRVVCMSDTHSLQNGMRHDIPHGDIFIHAGDFTRCGGKDEIIEFNQFLESLPHAHKLVIAGNHELSFDATFTHPMQEATSRGGRCKHGGDAGVSILDEIPTLGNTKESLSEAVMTENVRQYLTNCTYLEDAAVDLYGLKFYGTPWQPEFCRWAFNLPRGKACLDKWNLIPQECDVLITHTPPVGHGDLCKCLFLPKFLEYYLNFPLKVVRVFVRAALSSSRPCNSA